jgi:adenylate cyclase
VKRILEIAGQRGIDLFLALICGISLIALQATPPFQRAEWLAFDKLTQWTAKSRPLDSSLALVAIDDDSIAELGSASSWSWPWPRGAYADIIAYLKASGAREIWIDLVFYTPDPDGFQDDELTAVAAAAGNVHFGQGIGKDSVSRFQPSFNVAVPVTTEENPVIHTDINGQALLAWPEPFNVLKKPEYQFVTPAALLIKDGQNLLKAIPADDRTDPQKVGAAWANATPPPLAARFRDKIVYIGVTASSGYDYKAFPIGNHEPSTMIHIVARSNELQHGFFREIPDWLRALLVLACCFVTSDLFRRVPDFFRYLACVLLIIAVISLAAFVLFHARIWVRPVLYDLACSTTFVMVTSVNYVREGRKRRLTEDIFGKFVSRKLVDRLVVRPDRVKLGGEKAELTILFSDLSGFTTLSENMESDVLLGLLNDYLNEMSELIYEREGTLDKYIGDAIMAFWGAPDASPNHAWQACQAALACHQRLAEMAPAWEAKYGAKLTARIGINTDVMTVGLVGSNRLHNYSVIGDAVNLASRLEGANKPFGTSLMIAQRTLDLAQGKIEVRPIARLQVKGKENWVMVYELMAKAGELSAGQRVAQQLFTDAFAAFIRREWALAEDLLNQLLQQQPGDGLAQVYLKRVRAYAQNPPEPGWDGVFKLDEK